MSSLLDMLVAEAMESDTNEYENEYDYAEEAAISAFDDGSIVDPTDDVLYTIAAIESYISDLDFEMAMEAAMESEGADGGESPETKKAKGLGNRIRAAFARLRGAKTPSEVEDAQNEIDDATDELQTAIDSAETEEEKKKLTTAAKVGLAAGGVAVAALGMVALGRAAANKAKANGNEPKGLIKGIDDMVTAAGKKKTELLNTVKDKYENNETINKVRDRMAYHSTNAAAKRYYRRVGRDAQKIANSANDPRYQREVARRSKMLDK